MANDKAKMFGKDVPTHFSTNGHYAIDIFPKGRDDSNQDWSEQFFTI